MSGSVRSRFLAACTAIPVLAAVASAQSQTPSGTTAASKMPETVVVTGQRIEDQEAFNKVLMNFVDQHSARDRRSGLMVRAVPTGICPIVMGLPQAYADFVAARISEVAGKIGSPVQTAATKCIGNVEVIFTNDPQEVVNRLADRTRGTILGYYYLNEKHSLVHVDRPIQAWYVTGTKQGDSVENSYLDQNGELRTDNFGHIKMDRAYGGGLNTGTGSRIPLNNASFIMNSLIVADLNKVGGEEIGPIADYVALLALSQPETLDGCNELPSILDLFSSGCAGRAKPTALTDSDMAYLSSLYRSDITTSLYSSKQRVVKGMSDDLGGASPANASARNPTTSATGGTSPQ